MRVIVVIIFCLWFVNIYSYELTNEEQIEYNEWSNYISNGTYYQTAEGEDLGWKEGPYLKGYIYGYLAFKETKWLDKLVTHADVLFSRLTREQDGKLGWYGPSVYDNTKRVDALVGEALLLEPITLFILTVKKDPALSAYIAKAENYLNIIENELIPKRDARGDWQNVGNDEGIYRHEPYDATDHALMTHPYNKINEMGQVLINLYRITHKFYYRDKIERIARRFKRNIKIDDGGLHNWWDYWDPAGPWDYDSNGNLRHWVGVEHRTGYTNINMHFAAKCYHLGLVFDRSDIERMVRNFKDRMWNGSMTSPLFALLDGSNMGVNSDTVKTGMMDALIEFDKTILDLDWVTIDGNSWGGMVSLPYYFYQKWYGIGYQQWNDEDNNNSSSGSHFTLKMVVYPNPVDFSKSERNTVKFMCSNSNYFDLEIFDSSGRLIISLPSGVMQGKNYNDIQTGKAEWDGIDTYGNKCSSGIYYYVVKDNKGNKGGGKIVIKK